MSQNYCRVHMYVYVYIHVIIYVHVAAANREEVISANQAAPRHRNIDGLLSDLETSMPPPHR